MAEPHTTSPASHSHGTANQPPLAHGEVAGGSEAAGTKGDRIASLSSQLRGLTEEVHRGESAQAPPTAETNSSPVDTGREEDWGIAPPRSGISRETKLGLAFVFVLLVVFGFVVYKKVEHNRAATGDLMAGVDEPPVNPTEEPTSHSGGSVVNPIDESPFPPAQTASPFAETASAPPTDLTPASWSQESFGPPPHQEVVSAPPASADDPFAAQNQFPAETPTDFAPPVETPNAQTFFPEEQTQTTVVTTPPAPPTAVDQFAQAPVPDNFETPTQVTAQAPSQPAEDFNPFVTGNTVAQLEPTPTSAEFENEQFSAQSQPVPTENVAAPAEENPFGAFPPAQTAQQTPSPVVEADPFATPPPVVEAVPVEQSFDPSQSGQSITNVEPQAIPVEPPNPLPIEDNSIAEVPIQNDPRFGDFQPAPAGTTYEPVAHEFPGDQFAQNSLPADGVGGATATGGMLPNDRAEVYVVNPGDNYWKISKTQYGTVRYFMALARYNQARIPDPKKMRPGMKVLTPSRDLLESRNPDLFPKFASNAASLTNVGHQSGKPSGFFVDAQGKPMYRVGQNDTLGGIAQKHLGRFSRWVEIYQMNRHRLKDPNALTLGDVLELPANASRVNMARQASSIR